MQKKSHGFSPAIELKRISYYNKLDLLEEFDCFIQIERVIFFSPFTIKYD